MGNVNSELISSYWLCPLYFFEYDSEQIDLPEKLQIIKIPRKFVEYLDRSYPDTLPTILSEAKWAIAIKIERIDTTNMSIIESMSIGFKQQDNAMNRLFDLITTLRLYKKGRLVAGLATLATFHNSEWSIGGSANWTPVSNILFFKEEPIYKLRQSELKRFITLFKQIRLWRASGILDNVEIALERFHSSYHGNIEDRIIDQMVAFESLYLGDSQELTYKLALRVAFLLGKREEQRNLIFADMKKAYSYRSRIVHGNNPPSRRELRDIVPKVENYLRQSLRKFLLLLSQEHSSKDIRDKLLDENILKNGNLLDIKE